MSSWLLSIRIRAVTELGRLRLTIDTRKNPMAVLASALPKPHVRDPLGGRKPVIGSSRADCFRISVI